MKRFIKLLLPLAVIATVVAIVGPGIFKPNRVAAIGDLVIDFNVPEGDPIFVVENMLPGDTEDKNIDITNGGAISRLVQVKGVRTGGVGADPKLETILDIVIRDGATPIYGIGSPTGAKTVADFFTDSAANLSLGNINPGQHKTFNFEVHFPQAAGNEFQKKSVIFDLIFVQFGGDNLVINEVYYKVDNSHGLDCPKDRGILGVSGTKVTITNNGAGSTNTVIVSQAQACKILQSNTSVVQTNVGTNANTGSNTSQNNVLSIVNSIITGNANNNVTVNVTGSSNVNTLSCSQLLSKNDEWIEIYNPTDHDINLKNWTITDNSGNPVKINGNKIVKAGGFALIAKDNSVWNLWNENAQALKIALGAQIGNGLDNAGDHLILKDPANLEVDRMSWGNDITGFTPQAINPEVALGSSTERLTPGFDTDKATDWHSMTPPSPGL